MATRSACVLACALLCFSSVIARAQLSPQGPKLVGAGAVGVESHRGSAVALSADGGTAAVGGELDNGLAGAAWVFVRTGETWTQQGLKLVGADAVGAAQQGRSLALSADGNTLLMGGPFDNAGRGAAWVFVRSGGAWVQQGPKLLGPGASAHAGQANSVALSADGNTALLGGPGDSLGVGAVWVFVRTGGAWAPQGVKLVAADVGDAAGVRQGAAVSLSADGSTAVVGGISPVTGQNVVWPYVRDGTGWHQQGPGLIGSNATATGGASPSVSLSADGNFALVGSPGNTGGVGAAWMYLRSGGLWSQQGPMLLGAGAVGAAAQGWSVSLSASGGLALVGGVNDDGVRGAAWVFARNGSTWLQQGPKLVGIGSQTQSRQGWSVALSGSGTTAIVGGPGDGGGPGAAWVFAQSLRILAARDVPNDQGGEIRLTWQRSALDSVGMGRDQVTSYGVWRRLPPGATAPRTVASPARALADSLGLAYDFVAAVPAVQSPRYNVVVPTLADSSAAGLPRFTYLVTAHTSDPSLYYVSAADSAYSVDNLPPPPPGSFTAASLSGATQLHWTPSNAPDLIGYRLYRAQDPAFVPAPDNLLVSTAETGYVDPAAAGSSYKLSAVDVHGNESAFVAVGPTTDAPGDGRPLAFGLGGVLPNPSHGAAMRAVFTLARDAPARLELFDASGRRSEIREVGSLGPGRHELELGGSRSLAPGLYLLRLTQGARSQVARVTVVR
ncbi:MAG TPA: hypothetical protein VI504_15705 [Candidatus Eisenbacteria bacterium]|jgi:hypothetical protein